MTAGTVVVGVDAPAVLAVAPDAPCVEADVLGAKLPAVIEPPAVGVS